MTQSKGSFTPGPWEVEQSARDGATIRTSGRAPVWYIAAIARCLPGGPKETLANARLIAAAPALLEALRDLLAHRHEQDPHYSLEQVEARARAAIQSATGVVGSMPEPGNGDRAAASATATATGEG